MGKQIIIICFMSISNTVHVNNKERAEKMPAHGVYYCFYRVLLLEHFNEQSTINIPLCCHVLQYSSLRYIYLYWYT